MSKWILFPVTNPFIKVVKFKRNASSLTAGSGGKIDLEPRPCPYHFGLSYDLLISSKSM